MYLPVNCLYPLRILVFHHLARFAAMWLPLEADSCSVRRYRSTTLSNNPADRGGLSLSCVIHEKFEKYTLHFMTTHDHNSKKSPRLQIPAPRHKQNTEKHWWNVCDGTYLSATK
jgi:hypothetical protein